MLRSSEFYVRRSILSPLLVAFALCLTTAAFAQQTDEEKKALEEIEKKAAAEKKKALERIRKKAEEDKKKAEAKEKAEAAKKQKEEAAAQKKAERDKKKEEEKKKKEAAGKPEEPPPPPPPEAPPAPPPPPPPVKPAATPVEGVGAARWTGVGFVQAGDAKAPAEPKSSSGVAVPGVANLDSLTVVSMRVGASQAKFNPINDDRTDDATAFSMADFDVGVNAELRNVGQVLIPWFDLGVGFVFGSRKEAVNGTETGRVFKVFSNRFSGLFGLDLGPAEFVSLGPFVGYRLEMYSVSFQDESSTETAEAALHHGLQYGLHARLRTRAKPKAPSVLFADARYEWRRGEYQTANYAMLQIGLRAGPIYFTGWYEARLGSSGEFTPADVVEVGNTNKSLANASAASFPIEQRLGGGLLISFF